MHVGRYHRFLRVSLIVSMFILLFDGGFVFPITKQFSDVTITYLASVGSGTGMYATVPENEINMLTAQISERERELDARDAALREREIATRAFEGDDMPDYSTYIISTILFILTVLVILNYAMDWARVRSIRYAKQMG